MFAWDYNTFVMISMTLILAIVLGAWMFYTLSRSTRLRDIVFDELIQCPFCANVFRQVRRAKIMKCPCCASFIGEDLSPQGKGKYDA